ncbi:hypothetical protein BDZ45DRAFT_743048 [Acephala macrosclerotiorum]|nr:hypothetical protein BDZ45DRAFT_743048 [Acephala macrosclerotiorum]
MSSLTTEDPNGESQRIQVHGGLLMAAQCEICKSQQEYINDQVENQDSSAASDLSANNIFIETATLMVPASTPKFPWENLTHKLREQTFQLVDQFMEPGKPSYFKWQGSIPPLIVALKGYPVSMTIFCNNSERKAPRLSWTLRHHMILVIGVCENVRDQDNLDLWHHPKFKKLTTFIQQFLKLKNLREVHLTLSSKKSPYSQTRGPSRGFEDYDDAYHFITELPFGLQGCKKLSTVEVVITRNDMEHYKTEVERLSQAVVKRVSKKFGIESQYLRGIGFYNHFLYHWRADVWRWEARSGTLMDWSQDLSWYYNWEPKQRKCYG